MDKHEIFSVIKRGDIIFVAALVLLSAFLMLGTTVGTRQPAEYVVISSNGKNLAVIPLDENRVFEIDDGEHSNSVVIKDRAVYIAEASCPDKLCIACGAISKNGELIICLPNRLVVRIASNVPTDTDTVSY